MNFRKFTFFMFVVALIINVSSIKVYAAEDENVNKENVSTTETVTTNEEIVSTTVEDAVDNNLENTIDEETVKKEVENTAEVIKAEKKDTKPVAKVETKKYTNAELRLLSALIYCESQGESYNGKLAVGIVVMNRKRSNNYPDTVKGVIYQKYQFSPVTNGTLKKALSEYDKGNFTSSAEKDCIKAAKAALNGAKSITVKGNQKNFSKYLSFSGRLRGYTYRLGNHQFK